MTRHEFEQLPSTQDHLIGLARAGAPLGTVVVARRQTSGRGRADHSWSSPDGGLYLSILTARPSVKPVLLPLAVGERLREHLHDAYRVDAVLKWPNDVLARSGSADPRKIAGILADDFEVAGERRTVLGIGVNVSGDRSSFPPELRDQVTILAELTDYPPSVDQVERETVAVVHQTLELLETEGGRRALLAACRRSLYGRGRRVRVDGRPVGVLRDLGEDGELLIDAESGRVSVWAGDVTIEEET